MVLYLWRYVPTDNYLEEEPYYKCEMAIADAHSLVWCERYQTPGEFVLKIKATPELLQFFANNETLITRQDTKRAMIPETIELKTSAKLGDYLTISGRSVESILTRRAITQTYTLEGDVCLIIDNLIKENAGNYWYYNSDSEHSEKLEKLKFINLLERYGQYKCGVLTKAQPIGQNLGTFVYDLCAAAGIGFGIDWVDGKFKYYPYRGANRSIHQTQRTPVIFSEEFGNLGETVFSIMKQTAYTRIVVGGEGEGKNRKFGVANKSDRYGGMLLREKFIDSSKVSSNSSGVSSDSYIALLDSIAKSELDASAETVNLDAEALPGGQYEYRKDYNLGDTVTVRNSYGITGDVIVTEVVESMDSSGLKVVPKFTEWR